MDYTFDLQPQRRQYSVGELTAEISELLTDAYTNIWVLGEISGLKVATSGHAYFTLKDDRASLKCACWKGAYRLLRFKPQDGVEVLARGRIEVYEPRGEYQLIVESIEPVGAGALQLAFEQLKKKLAAEGLFDADRKRPLPRLPRHIAVITSATGAVIRDILHVIERRFPGLHIRLYPAQVQGAGAAQQVVAGLDYFSQNPWADIVILARGGGSIEDLWTFNDESVARAIARSEVPIISAIGHETDFTIADFVADYRAPTPSAAAEIVTGSRDIIFEQISSADAKLGQVMHLRLARAARKLSELGTQRAQMNIERRLYRAAQRIDEADAVLRQSLTEALNRAMGRWQKADLRLHRQDLRLKLQDVRHRLASLESKLQAGMKLKLDRASASQSMLETKVRQLSPLAILNRGYAVVTRENGQILRRAADARPGEPVRLRLAVGEAKATID